MDVFGHITFIDDPSIKVPFFRKYFQNVNEKAIVEILFKHQNHNLLRILRVENDYYDAELLDLFYEDMTNLHDDIKNNLAILHDYNIIYIDLKDDNVGYSHIDKKWKLFDFDCSGICSSDKETWIYSPNDSYNLQKSDLSDSESSTGSNSNLTVLDEIIYRFYTSKSLLDLDTI